MSNDISIAKENIYSFPSQFDFFKQNDLQSACYKLTCDIEEIFLRLLSTQMVMTDFDRIAILQDRFRGGYRAAIKWAFQYCAQSDKPFLPNACQYKFGCCGDTISVGAEFANIRNAFDQAELGKLKISIDDHRIQFSPSRSIRDVNADLYARFIDHEKYTETENKKTISYDQKTFAHMVNPDQSSRWNDFSKRPHDKQLFSKIYKDCLKKVKIDTEDYSNFDFGEFTLEDYEKVYAVLMALGVMNFNYQRTSRERNQSSKSSSPIFFSEITSLIQFIVDNSKVKRKAIKRIIELLTYDYEFHKNKVTVVQPLFSFGKFVFFSPSLLYYSDAVDKLLYLVKELNNTPEVISKIAKEREQVMTDRIMSFIAQNSNLQCIPNYKLILNGKPVAEFDILVYDANTNSLLLTELKYFFKADGEDGHQKVDLKIQDAIKLRLSRQRLAEKHIDVLLSDAFGISSVATAPKIKSCIVSQNYSGSSFLEDKIAVFDEFLFKHTLSRYEYNLDVLFTNIENDSYIPDMSDAICYHDYTQEYAGYEITYPGLVQKT